MLAVMLAGVGGFFMVWDLKGIRIAVLGGDRRQVYLMAELVRLGAGVSAFGFPPCPELEGVNLAASVLECVAGARVVVLPMAGTDPEGRIGTLAGGGALELTPQLAQAIPPRTLVLVGFAREFLRRLAAERGWRLVELAAVEELAVLNSIPSAEGAIQIAMEELPITLHGSNSFVLGFGRLGKTLARMLGGIGARTTVVARDPADLARAFEMGFRAVPFSSLASYLPEADVVFNTVPARVLDANLLALLPREALVIDLASEPGGTDFAAAAELGVRALLAPGLPGKVAPKTSGRMLAQVIPRLVVEELQKP